MLDKLFGSNARVKLLKLFLLHPETKYYIRQLARELKLQINSVRRELENLEELGLLVSSIGTSDESENEDAFLSTPIEETPSADKKKKKAVKSSKIESGQEKKYYQANSAFPLLEEIKSLIVRAQLLYKDDLVERIKRTGKVKLLVLTGIFTSNPHSMVDILVVGRVDKPRLKRAIKTLEDDIGREVNYTLMDSREFNYRREITDVFLYGILEGKMIIAVDEVGFH